MQNTEIENQPVDLELNSNKRKRPESPISPSNDEKRRKLEPSKVLFLRQLPHNCMEQDILRAIPEAEYGTLNIVIVNSNHTAFIEFENIDLAKKLLEKSENSELLIRDRAVKVTWSERQELEKKPAEVETPSKVLLVTIINARYPLLAADMEKLFNEYGLEKVTCFTSKQGLQQALVQFRSVHDASTAKVAVEGQTIFNNCRVHLKFSKIDEIVIRSNTNHAKDRTKSDSSYGQGYGHGQGYQNQYYNEDSYHDDHYDSGYQNNYSYNYGNQPHKNMNQGKVILVNNLSEKTTCDELFILFGVWGDVEAVKIHSKNTETAFIEFTTPQGAESALFHTKGNILTLHGKDLVVQRSKHNSIIPSKYIENDTNKQTFKLYRNHPQHRFKGKRPMKNLAPPSSSLHFANLHGDVTEDELKAYVDPFGTVKSIKLFGRKDCTTKEGEPIVKQMAIVEFSSLSSAVRVLVNRHVGEELHGLKPTISFANKRNMQK